MDKFQELKETIIKLASVHTNDSCSAYRKVQGVNTETELLQCIYENLQWCINHKVISHEYLSKFDPLMLLNSGIANTGLENTGFANSGNRNSGDSNSGNSNSGNSNSGNWNSGNRNSGDRNSGNRNSGNRNSGDSNSGNSNSGNSNSGNSNSGNSNSGNSNSGNWNSGNWNSGNSNSGDRNSGNWNSGNWNSGNRNSGDSNSGYRNSGAFCTDQNPKAILFNKESSMTVKEWEQSKAFKIMANKLNITFWVDSENMSEFEKEKYPKHETTGGYLKAISLKEAWINMWGNLIDEDKQVFYNLEHFDAKIFAEITGINI